jgi:AcrR family transcriptional regulator
MAREKDENKRIAVLQTSKLLFSSKGFVNTSIADIVRETGMSVGTIYTYFKSKDEIVRAIVEEGWRSLYSRMEKAMAGGVDTQAGLKLLVDIFLPELLQDLPLINILLSEAIDYTRLEEKVEKLTDLVFSLLKADRPEAPGWPGVPRQMLRTGLIVIFLGVLNAVRVTRRSSLGIRTEDIIGFVDFLTRGSLGLPLEVKP